MTFLNKLRNTHFIITASFYAVLLLVPAFVQNGGSDFSAWTSFFFSRTLNIFLCIIPALLAVFLSRKKFAESTLITAMADTVILLFIYSDFFFSQSYFLNFLVAVFILLFIFANTNELFAAAGIIPFFFLSKLGMLHYIIAVAVPLIFILASKLRTTENKTKKLIIKITLFIQCYTCVFFAVLLLLKKYALNITSTSPQVVTPALTIKAISSIALLILVAIISVIKISDRKKESDIAEKLLSVIPVVFFVIIGIAGYFTDIISTKNSTSVLFALIYILIFTVQSKISDPAEKTEETKFIKFSEIAAVVIFCLSMIS